MNNKQRLLSLSLALLALIVIAGIVYQRLSDRVDKDSLVTYKGATPTPITTTNETNSSSDLDATNETEAETKVYAPDFNVLDQTGKSISLSSRQGKPIVLNFWASWCPPCKEEMPDFERVYQELGREIDFMMVDVVDGQRETMELGQAFIDEQGFTFPIYFDTEQEALYNYGIRSIPTTYFINSEGVIVAGSQGMIDEETLRRGIQMIQNP